MKKKIKVGGLIMAFTFALIGTTAFKFQEAEPAGKTWTTSTCQKTNSTGTTTWGSGCDKPLENGPCDKKKDCVVASSPE